MISKRITYEIYLFNKLKNGNRDSFRFFFETYYSDLCNYVNLFVKNESLSEEIVQEVYIYLWDYRKKIIIDKSVRTYLFTASKNKYLNHIRNEKVRTRTFSKLKDNPQDQVPRPDEIVEKQDFREMLDKVISSLPLRCREIFLLSRIHGYTNGEIAAELNISHKTVENQITIAYRKIREQIEKSYPEFVIS